MLSNFKLQHILFITFTLIASLPVMMLGYWVQRAALEKEISAVEEKHLLVAKNVTRDLSRYIKDVENSFKLVITNLLASNKIDGISAHFETLNIRYIDITDTQGNILTKIASTKSNENNTKIKSELWQKLQGTIQQANKTDKMAFSDLIRPDKQETTFFIVKKLDKARIAIAALSTKYLQEVEKQISFGRRGHVAIVDRTGRAIAHPVVEWVTNMKDMSAILPVKKMMNGETGVTKFYAPAMRGTAIAGYTVVARTGWGVMVPQPFEELEEHARISQNTTLIIMLVGITVAGFISWFISGVLVGPIHLVVSATKFSENADHKLIKPIEAFLSQRFIPKEVLELLESFNSMGRRLNSITEQLYSKIDFANKEVNEQNVKLKDQARELQIKNEELARLSTTDTLTNLFNRRLFDEMLETEFAFAVRHQESLSLVMLDIDHFKLINDEYGHIQGDRVLQEVATLLKNNYRSSDVAFRIGGEEFAVLCRRTNTQESKLLAESLRQSLEQYQFNLKGKIITVTGSIGIVTIPQKTIKNSESFYRFTDQAMYYSKNHGRNCVTHYHDIC
ncbi:diguanylate cyclase/phosphodiesterase (GGDEF & EAL domains) with PAS/PAC sensor(s) [hydrothermal vent metagenome]|uniref:Diguanylate cyclase/phosphodiesterase (GGDEF & EAL domains) with PAS/PAC sensor(S) n=1 Tax=hydrothermal vent metagenome TaxID=652676 RepID=A0A3B1AEJ0_9ZZZZ